MIPDVERHDPVLPATVRSATDPGTTRRPATARRARWLLGVGTLVCAAAVATACGSATTTAAPPPAAAASPGTSPAAQATVVPVQMTEFRLALPTQTFAPGTYTFNAINAGKVVHAIEIDGPGINDQRTQGVVQPGQSAPLTVTLQPGTYEMYCPVDGHKAMGMDLHFTVGNAPAPSGSSSGGTGSGAKGGGTGSGY